MPIARLELLIAHCAFYNSKQHQPIALDYVTFVASEKRIICALRHITNSTVIRVGYFVRHTSYAYGMFFLRFRGTVDYYSTGSVDLVSVGGFALNLDMFFAPTSCTICRICSNPTCVAERRQRKCCRLGLC
jgi:hypothetical protein